MKEPEKQRPPLLPRPLQPRLDHRGGIEPGAAPLFPPVGTFEAIGGRPAIARIVDGLYDRIETDSLLRPAFGRDLTLEREHLKRFFEAWFGGPPAYFDTEWSPGLKGRHAGLSISRAMAGRWAGHFLRSFAEVVDDPQAIEPIRPIIARLALGLVNRPDEPVSGERLRGSTYSADPTFLRHIQHDDAAGITASAGAQPQIIRRHGPALLLIAAVRGKTRAAEALVRQGVDVNVPAMLAGSEAATHSLPMLHITPLCGALARRREAVVQLLVEHGAQSDIFTAAFLGDLDAVRQLLA